MGVFVRLAKLLLYIHVEKRSGSVVECLTQDQGVVGWSLTWGAAFCARKTHVDMTEKNADWDVKNQNKQKLLHM